MWCQLGDNTLKRQCSLLKDADHVLNLRPLSDAVPCTAGTPGFRGQGVEVGAAPLPGSPNDSLAEFALVLAILDTAGLEGLVPKEIKLPSGGTTIVPLNWMRRWPPGHCALTLLNQQSQKRLMYYLE